jgi:hypothetical protein
MARQNHLAALDGTPLSSGLSGVQAPQRAKCVGCTVSSSLKGSLSPLITIDTNALEFPLQASLDGGSSI